VGGALDRARRKAELFGGVIVVDAQVAAVLLLGQHLAWLAQRTRNTEFGLEGSIRRHRR
jgi:hypothetical protein